MANIRSEAESKELHRKILTAATALFMQKGFERTTVLEETQMSKYLYMTAATLHLTICLQVEFT